MKDLIEGFQFLGIRGTTAVLIVGIFVILQIIGELLEFKGKVVPECLKIRKYFQRKKNEKETQRKLLQASQEILTHYTADKIAERNEWMNWVNERADIYDNAVEKLLALQDKLNENNEITLDLYINANRNRIIDFARIVADDNALVSKEEFNRIYKINTEYHNVLKKYNKENGEVDTAMQIINEAYDYRMRQSSFIENLRGYANNNSIK